MASEGGIPLWIAGGEGWGGGGGGRGVGGGHNVSYAVLMLKVNALHFFEIQLTTYGTQYKLQINARHFRAQ